METMKMIFDAILPYLCEIIIAVISILVARYVLPYVKNDFIPWLKEKHLTDIIKKFVQAVEKLAEAGIIEKCDKKQKVIELLEKKGITINETVDAFIESCVKELDLVSSVLYDEIIDEESEEEPKAE